MVGNGSLLGRIITLFYNMKKMPFLKSVLWVSISALVIFFIITMLFEKEASDAIRLILAPYVLSILFWYLKLVKKSKSKILKSPLSKIFE